MKITNFSQIFSTHDNVHPLPLTCKIIQALVIFDSTNNSLGQNLGFYYMLDNDLEAFSYEIA